MLNLNVSRISSDRMQY